MKKKRRSDEAAKRRRAFTLMEALIAITILLVIILFTSKIFSSASDVTAMGQANADVMQEVAAMERQMRQDFERLSTDGFMMIRCRAVRNAINDPTALNPDLWLNPDLPPNAYVRSDQILFFSQGVATTQVFAPNATDNRKPQSTEARIYWGHGFQLGPFDDDPNQQENVHPNFGDLPPWHRGPLLLTTGNEPAFFQPAARQWTLARQSVLLAHDGGQRDNWGSGQGESAQYLWNPGAPVGFDNLIRNSRVDAAASRLGEVRNWIYRDPTSGNIRRWGLAGGMFDAMRSIAPYPRAERSSPTMFRADHPTSVTTLGSAVSDFMIDWTYEDGTGFTPDPFDASNPYQGVRVAYAGTTPWYGLSDTTDPNFRQRGVHTLAEGFNDDSFGFWVDPRGPIRPVQFEVNQNTGSDVYEYIVVFGPNRDRPLNDDVTDAGYGTIWDGELGTAGNMAYTPWPSALRITLRAHDVRTTLEQGREVQFVINLPKRK